MKRPRLVHESWYNCPAFNEEITGQINKTLMKGTFYPTPRKKMFIPFRMPLDKVRVVIIGLSPYHNDYKGTPNATGFAFGIPDEDRPFKHWPKSLQVLSDALANEYEIDNIEYSLIPTLTMWEEEGVLLLNTALSCLIGTPKSHLKLWATFMKELTTWLAIEKPGLIWWFLGTDAKKLTKPLFLMNHYDFYSYHPAYWAREEKPMIDSHFKNIDKVYQELYGRPITWVLPF